MAAVQGLNALFGSEHVFGPKVVKDRKVSVNSRRHRTLNNVPHPAHPCHQLSLIPEHRACAACPGTLTMHPRPSMWCPVVSGPALVPPTRSSLALPYRLDRLRIPGSLTNSLTFLPDHDQDRRSVISSRSLSF